MQVTPSFFFLVEDLGLSADGFGVHRFEQLLKELLAKPKVHARFQPVAEDGGPPLELQDGDVVELKM